MKHKSRKSSGFSLAVVGLLCCITSAACATPLTIGFSGDYAIDHWVEGGSKMYTFGSPRPGAVNPEQWLLGEPGDVITSSAPDSIAIRAASHGPDAPEIPAVRSLFTFTTTAVTNGTVSFDWDHDVFGSAPLVRFGYIHGTFHILSSGQGGYANVSESGTDAFLVNTGDTFGFFAEAFDSFNGVGIGTVSNFAVNPIPVPPAIGLFLSAIGLMGWVGKGRSE